MPRSANDVNSAPSAMVERREGADRCGGDGAGCGGDSSQAGLGRSILEVARRIRLFIPVRFGHRYFTFQDDVFIMGHGVRLRHWDAKGHR
jgi:hypothetical protein